MPSDIMSHVIHVDDRDVPCERAAEVTRVWLAGLRRPVWLTRMDEPAFDLIVKQSSPVRGVPVYWCAKADPPRIAFWPVSFHNLTINFLISAEGAIEEEAGPHDDAARPDAPEDDGRRPSQVLRTRATLLRSTTV